MKDLLKYVGETYRLGMDLYMINGFTKAIEKYCLYTLLIQDDSESGVTFKLNLVSYIVGRSVPSVDEKNVYVSEIDALRVLRETLLENHSTLFTKIEQITSQIESMENK